MTQSAHPETPVQNTFQKRFRILTICFCLCFAIMTGRVIYLAAIAGNRLRSKSDQLSKHICPLPASRGKILFADGTPAAWNERQFDLWISSKKLSSRHQQMISAALPRCGFDKNFTTDRPVCQNLTAEEILMLKKLIKKNIPLKIRSSVFRRTVKNPALQKKIGKIMNGKGISGWEKEYDHLLTGTPGYAEVILDRTRLPIHSSVQILQNPEHGKDIILPESVTRQGVSNEN